MNLIRKLARDSNYKMSLLIALGCFTGLRISDILALRWNQILDAEEFTIIEIKTGKQRTIRINMQLQQHIRDCYEHINPVGINAPVLISQKGTVYTVQRINVMLKEIKKKYRLHIGNFSCHSLRKTFGRQVYNMNNDNSELALVKLMELFNHSSVSITKRYLGLRQEELLNTYDCLSFKHTGLVIIKTLFVYLCRSSNGITYLFNERRFALSLSLNFAKILHYEDMLNAHTWLYTCYLTEYHSLGVGNLCVFVVWVFGDT